MLVNSYRLFILIVKVLVKITLGRRQRPDEIRFDHVDDLEREITSNLSEKICKIGQILVLITSNLSEKTSTARKQRQIAIPVC